MTPRSTPVRVAIAGAGLMGRWHAAAAARAGATIAAIVDMDGSRGAGLATRYPACRALPDLSSCLDHVDIVHVCTPTATHGRMVRQILDARVHALVEKPLATDAAETADLLALAATRGVLLCPVHQFVFQRGMQRALAQLASIGPLRHVDVTICSAGATGATDAVREQVAADILPHPLSLVQRVLAARVADLGWVVHQPVPGDVRTATACGETTVSILISMSGRPTTNAMRLIGARGTIHVDLFHGFAVAEPGGVSRARKVTQPFTRSAAVATAAALNLLQRSWRQEPAYPGLWELVSRFHAAAASGGESPIGAADALDVARARDRIAGNGPTRLAVAEAG